MIILFDRLWDILVANRRVYFMLNALYYGLIIFFMLYGSIDRALHDKVLETYRSNLMGSPVMVQGKPDSVPEAFELVGIAFGINVLGSSYASITLPSFVIPFVGIAAGLYRAVILGLGFTPADPTISRIFFPHLPTLLLEGQGSILAMLGAYIHGRAWLWPATVERESRWKAYVEGVRQSGTLYMLIMPVLLISAIYGVIESVILATP